MRKHHPGAKGKCETWVTAVYLPPVPIMISLNVRVNSWVGWVPVAPGQDQTQTCGFVDKHANHYTAEAVI